MSSNFYKRSFVGCKQRSSFSNHNITNISGVLGMFSLNSENVSHYEKVYESLEEMLKISQMSFSESLETTQEVGSGQYGFIICQIAMLHTTDGVLHVPVQLYHDTMSKQQLENITSNWLLDDSWSIPLSKFFGRGVIDQIQTLQMLEDKSRSSTVGRLMPPEVIRIVIDQAFHPHRIMINHENLSQMHWDNGANMNIAGWKHKMEFWAFPLKRSVVEHHEENQ